MKTIQLYTQIKIKNGFRGAQKKTKDYFDFINSHKEFRANIAFQKCSEWSRDVEWDKEKVLNNTTLNINSDFFLLKSGNDWLKFNKNFPSITNPAIISPVLNYRILNEKHPSNILLNKNAIRVCPNPDLTEKIKKTTTGNVYTIPHGVNTQGFNLKRIEHRVIDILIVAIKNQDEGKELYSYLKTTTNKNIQIVYSFINHDKFLTMLADSKVTIHLPQKKESFYLPGLEGMQLGSVTIMPDCLGNTYYSINNKTAFICGYDYPQIYNKIKQVLNLDIVTLQEVSTRSTRLANRYSLEYEQELWHKLLDNLV
jgi:hypothetical protein